MTGLWAAFKAAGSFKKAMIVLAIIGAIFAVIKIGGHLIDGNNEAQRDLGAAKTTNDNLTTTIERTEKANEAAETIERDPDARRAGCLRHSRTPQNC